MPLFGLLHFLIAIGFVIHAHNTGRPQYWMFILLFLPLVGSLAYVLFELFPELANSRRARKVASDLRTVVDPHREWRELSTQIRESDTIDAKCKFAEECERKEMWSEAITMYRQAAQGYFADDPDLLRRLARAELGSGDAKAALQILDDLRAKHPEYQNQGAHLTYARALEALDRLVEARAEYQALSGYFIGVEARTRYALLLDRLGEPLTARKLFEEVVRTSRARGIVLSDDDREWVRIAKARI